MKPIPHKPMKEPPLLIAFDSEDDSEGHVKSFSFTWFTLQGKLRKKTFYDTEDARDFVRNFPGPPCIFIAHNLEYDLINLYREVGFEELEEMQYTAKLVSAKIKGRKHRFLDSFSFFPSSLEEMGDSIGLKKLDFDPDSLEYAERDPEIVLKFINAFRENIIEAYDIDLTNTVGGLSMRIFLEYYLKREFTPFNHQICLDAFYGGRCEVFYKGPVKQKIYESDINSEYPTVMCYEFPDTDTIAPVSDLSMRFGIAKCKVQAPEDIYIPVLPARVDGKLLFPVGIFTGTWTFAELKAAVARGYKILKIYEAYGTDTGCFPFKQFMEEHYQKRIASTNKLIQLFVKLLMNNLYGKLITHKDRCIITHGPYRPKKWEIEGEDYELVNVYGDIYVYKARMVKPPPSANYMWGAYVTSYGRLLLLDNLEKVHATEGATLCYCDTDSVSSFGTKPSLDYDQTRLGALKSEEWDGGCFYMPKGYILFRKDKKKVTCKGVSQPHNIKKEGKELTPENPRYQFLETGRATFRKPVKFRQSLISKETPNYWKNVTKRRLTTTTKRREESTGSTYPLHIT
jgi:hypothetical protein